MTANSPCNDDKAFGHVAAPDKGAPIGYFMCLESLPLPEESSLAQFVTDIRGNFSGFSEKKFLAVLNHQSNNQLNSKRKTELNLMLVALHFLNDFDNDDYMEKQIIQFSKNYCNPHIVLVSGDSNFCRRFVANEELSDHYKYLIHDMESKEDSIVLEQADDAIHLNRFVNAIPNPGTAFNDNFNSIKAPEVGTPLVVLVDIENRMPHRLFNRLASKILNHFQGFELKEFVAAASQKSYNKMNKQVLAELNKTLNFQLHFVEKKENSADAYLMKQAVKASRDYKNAYFVIMTSDHGFCSCIIELKHHYNHPVYLIHSMKGEKSSVHQCMMQEATQAIPLEFFKKMLIEESIATTQDGSTVTGDTSSFHKRAFVGDLEED